jgi:hypothetical protein
MYMPALSTGLSGGDSLPHRLDAGQPSAFHQRLPDLQNDLRSEGYTEAAEVTAVVKDALGNEFTKRVKIRLL